MYPDPYITLELLPRISGSQQVRTKVVYERLNPAFNEYLSLPLASSDVQKSMLWLRVWDHDALSKDDPMGHVLIPLKDLMKDMSLFNPSPKWYTLQPEVC